MCGLLLMLGIAGLAVLLGRIGSGGAAGTADAGRQGRQAAVTRNTAGEAGARVPGRTGAHPSRGVGLGLDHGHYRFEGGPLHGQLRKLPRGTNELRVPFHKRGYPAQIARYRRDLEDALGVPVVDPCQAAATMAIGGVLLEG